MPKSSWIDAVIIWGTMAKDMNAPFQHNNKQMNGHSAVLRIVCPDKPGLVALFSGFVSSHQGNILHADQHLDRRHGLFLTRLEWALEGFSIPQADIHTQFQPIAQSVGAVWNLDFSNQEKRVAVFVSKTDHCLRDLIWKVHNGELPCQIALVVSNHEQCRAFVEREKIRFVCIPVHAENRRTQEHVQLALVQEERVNLIVLARYMQILSPEFVALAPPTVNIHHSFLPAFAGAQAYEQAYQRGVKLIGATAHYVSDQLDGGPIIAQNTATVSHRDELEDFKRKGRSIERDVLTHATRAHLLHRVLVYKNRTVVFD